MICAWNALLDILPLWMKDNTDKIGRDSLLELRMRVNSPPELVLQQGIIHIDRKVKKEDLIFCINKASRYSPWSAATVSQGYITSQGGHRIGICGDAVCQDGTMSGIRSIRSICIRVARDFPGISRNISTASRSILIIGAPGWGKTTLLRDLIRRIGERETVCVVDERGELFPDQFVCGNRVDVMSGCSKADGLELLLRTMGPDRIALDEISALEDAQSLIHAVGCGVGILATAHGISVEDMLSRPIYKKMWDQQLFDSVVILHHDKSYHVERLRT